MKLENFNDIFTCSLNDFLSFEYFRHFSRTIFFIIRIFMQIASVSEVNNFFIFTSVWASISVRIYQDRSDVSYFRQRIRCKGSFMTLLGGEKFSKATEKKMSLRKLFASFLFLLKEISSGNHSLIKRWEMAFLCLPFLHPMKWNKKNGFSCSWDVLKWDFVSKRNQFEKRENVIAIFHGFVPFIYF